MFFTKKYKNKLGKLSSLFNAQCDLNVLVGDGMCDLEKRIKELERRNAENENVINFLIEEYKDAKKRTVQKGQVGDCSSVNKNGDKGTLQT